MAKQIRCAIYTRKSSEEGLEMEFNSLDAQREACEAYINSQKHEGWVIINKQYNDGGFSGGTIERLAFKALLEDIKGDTIDIVVVYKVDRLTRSLMDFAKIVDIFDEHKTSFVSITQQFNTTTSMGRLTLNMLLSFAQFEREVTSERLRDKFEASRKKGMFLQGRAPIGYKKDKNTLIIDPKEAPKIKLIFEKYLEFGSARKLHNYMVENNICTLTGKNFRHAHLCKLLKNKVYIGKISYKDKVYEGLHEGIIDEELFEKVQLQMQLNSAERKFAKNNHSYALLTSKLFDDNGNYMSPNYSNNRHKKRYRYYTSQAIIQNRPQDEGSLSKIPGNEIENFIRKEVGNYLKNKDEIQKLISHYPVKKQAQILNGLGEITITDQIIRCVLKDVILSKDEVKIRLNQNILIDIIEKLVFNQPLIIEIEETDFITLNKNVSIVATPRQGNKIITGDEIEYNMSLIQAITKGFYYYKLREENKLTREQRNSSHVNRLINLRYLPPNVIEDILNGKQDPALTVKKLYEMSKTI